MHCFIVPETTRRNCPIVAYFEAIPWKTAVSTDDRRKLVPEYNLLLSLAKKHFIEVVEEVFPSEKRQVVIVAEVDSGFEGIAVKDNLHHVTIRAKEAVPDSSMVDYGPLTNLNPQLLSKVCGKKIVIGSRVQQSINPELKFYPLVVKPNRDIGTIEIAKLLCLRIDIGIRAIRKNQNRHTGESV